MTNKWLIELRHHCPGTPVVLLGLKSDLREGGGGGAREGGREGSIVSFEEAQALAKEIGKLE